MRNERIIALAALVFFGCTDRPSSIEVPLGDGRAALNGKDPQGATDNNQPTLPGGIELPTGEFFRAAYKLSVKTKGGLEICGGKAELLVRINPFGFEVPAGAVKCLLNMVQIDLKSMLAGLSAGANGTAGAGMPGPQIVEGLSVQAPLIRARTFNSVQFIPDRPMFLAPFSLTVDELDTFERSETVQVRDPAGAVSNGSFVTRVVGTNETYNTERGATYDKVVRWEMRANGFAAAKDPRYFLFDRVEVGINLEPIAITKVAVEGRVKDFMKAMPGSEGQMIQGLGSVGQLFGGGGGGGGAIIGALATVLVEVMQMRVSLELIEQRGLTSNP